MIIYVDIDNTICTQEENYFDAKPFPERIEAVNKLYNDNTIIYWTARGATTGIDWSKITKKQLEKWGCLFHDLKMNKPEYDLFIDDKSMQPKEALCNL